MGKRTLWETRVYGFDGFPAMVRRHSSELAAYQYIQSQATAWSVGELPGRYVSVFVDERDGLGWQTYEHIDLNEICR